MSLCSSLVSAPDAPLAIVAQLPLFNNFLQCYPWGTIRTSLLSVDSMVPGTVIEREWYTALYILST